MSKKAPRSSSPMAAQSGAAAKKNHRLVIADDSISIQKLVHLTFAGGDWDVITASDAQDALMKIKNLKPDVALLASNLSEKLGLDLVHSLKQDLETQNVGLVLLCTAQEKAETPAEDFDRCDAVIAKPFEGKDLLALIENLEDSRVEESTVISLNEQAAPVAAAPAAETAAADPRITASQSMTPPSFDAESYIREWIDKNLPAMAERLLKAEISASLQQKKR